VDLSPADLRLNVAACVTTSELISVVDVLKREALLGDTQAIALLLKYACSLPSKRGEPVVIDETQLDTAEGCLTASMDIFRELAAGRLDHDSATALRSTVDLAMKAHQAKQGERATDALEDMGSQIVFAEAGRMEDSLREIGAAMDAQQGMNDGN
jgi:hypothetical protein